MDLKFTVRTHGQFTVLSVSGEIDLATADQLRDKLAGLIAGGQSYVVVDLGAVDFLDSTGLSVLVGARRTATRHGGDLHLVCIRPNIRRLLEITGLDTVISVHDTMDDALKVNQ